MKVIIEAAPQEIAALISELQERPVGEIEIPFDGSKITKAVVQAIRDKCVGNT